MLELTNEYLNYKPRVPKILYHYCSMEVFLSIIQNKSIWLSDANKTNDPSELNYIFNFFTSTIDECLEKYTDKYTNLIVQKVKAIANTTVYNLVYEKAPIARYKKNFICCFSEAKDLLSQWRAYGNDGNGVAIGFNSDMLSRMCCDESFGFTKVIYSEKKMKDFLDKTLLSKLQWAIDSCIDKGRDDKVDEQELLMQVSMIILSIWQEGFVFKHSSFREEREWRLYKYIASTNYHFDKGVDDYGYAGFLDGVFRENDEYMGEFTRSSLKYRASCNNIYPYFEIGFNNCKNKMIKQIVLGPKCEMKELDLKLLLAQNRYITDVYSEEIKIIKAKSPYK